MEGEFPQKTGVCFMQNTMVVWERDILGIMKKERKMFRNASNRGKHIFCHKGGGGWYTGTGIPEKNSSNITLHKLKSSEIFYVHSY